MKVLCNVQAFCQCCTHKFHGETGGNAQVGLRGGGGQGNSELHLSFDEIFLHASDTVRGAEDLAFSNNVGEMLSLDFFLLVFSSFVSF